VSADTSADGLGCGRCLFRFHSLNLARSLTCSVLWIGVFNLFYPVWDYVDEVVFDKPNASDCTQLADMSGQPASREYSNQVQSLLV
jgi:hypothetical protein